MTIFKKTQKLKKQPEIQNENAKLIEIIKLREKD